MLKPVATTTVSSCEDYIELAELAGTINDYLVFRLLETWLGW
jgi:hypothetical protein